MFNRIAPAYDLMNRILSLGRDIAWRKAAVLEGGVGDGELWLDLAAGSGAMAASGLSYSPASRWVAIDPSRGLLARLKSRRRLRGLPVIEGVGEELPFGDETFDGITVAFGLRNFIGREKGLAEMRRVLRSDGRLVILEFLPLEKGKWGRGRLVRGYLNGMLRLAGGWLSGDRRAYGYLSRSARCFWTRDKLSRKLKEAGFDTVAHRGLMMEAVTLTIAEGDKR